MCISLLSTSQVLLTPQCHDYFSLQCIPLRVVLGEWSAHPAEQLLLNSGSLDSGLDCGLDSGLEFGLKRIAFLSLQGPWPVQKWQTDLCCQRFPYPHTVASYIPATWGLPMKSMLPPGCYHWHVPCLSCPCQFPALSITYET